MTITGPRSSIEQTIRTTRIRDLVERNPELLPVLDTHGIDTCCGGGVTPLDAARAHGIDPDLLVNVLVDAIQARTE